MTEKRVLVFGATGNIGGALSREMLKRDWHVRAVTRNPEGEKAKTLASHGAEVIAGDMDDWTSIQAAMAGFKKVFSVQNWAKSGVQAEIRQGKRVAEVAAEMGIEHLVYGSAGENDPHTGIPHFDSKLEVEAHMRALGLPFTTVRPAPFMELMRSKEFFPPLGVWGAQIKIIGWDKPIPWIAVQDIGIAIANIFENPRTWIGKEVTLFGDIKSMRECQEIFKNVTGKAPFRLPLPLPIFKKMAGPEMVMMWQWLDAVLSERGSQALQQEVANTQKLHPDLLSVESWLTTNFPETQNV